MNLEEPEEPLYRWKLVLEYDGTLFKGWARQPGVRTVQGELEAVLQQLFQHPVHVIASGRTDAGVHALRQVASFATHKARPAEKVFTGLNALLAEDVACVEVEPADLNFRPRFWALSKTYQYSYLERDARSPLRRRRAWHVGRPLNVGDMNLAIQALVGQHDFSSFRAQGCRALHAVRIIQAARVERIDDQVELTVQGHGFLRHMVRIIAGTLYEVGTGRRTVQWMEQVLQSQDRTLAGRTAPAHGLCLIDLVMGDEVAPWHGSDLSS